MFLWVRWQIGCRVTAKARKNWMGKEQIGLYFKNGRCLVGPAAYNFPTFIRRTVNNNYPSKFFWALQSYCPRLSVVLLSNDSKLILIRLDRRKKFGLVMSRSNLFSILYSISFPQWKDWLLEISFFFFAPFSFPKVSEEETVLLYPPICGRWYYFFHLVSRSVCQFVHIEHCWNWIFLRFQPT